jgi:hypothetical protein
MKSLADAVTLAETAGRLGGLTPDSKRRWGTLTPNEMLCHLADSFDGVIRSGVSARRVPVWKSTVVKWIALYLPIHWPHGVRTRAAVDPRRDGTRPAAFDGDLQRTVQSMNLFADHAGREWGGHPIFGPLSTLEWMRWGYLHADHHLRQFGL